MAPEQLFGSADVDARADVWSIAAILYEMLAGRPPFDLPTFTRICAELSTNRPPPSLVERRPDVTPELEAVIMKCFLRNPDERTHDVAELAGNLLDAVQAPFAAPMRQKIASMLDPGATGGAAMSSSGASMPSGAYGGMTSGAYAALSTTGTGSGPRKSLTESGNVSGSPGSTAGAQVVEAEPPHRSALIPGLAVGALVVVGIVAYVSLTGHGAAQPAPPAPASVAQPTAPPTSTMAVATASAAIPAPSASSSSAPVAASAASVAATPPRPPPGHPYWHPAPHPPPPPATTTVAAQTTPPPAPTPAPTPPAPTSKADPLGDRQ